METNTETTEPTTRILPKESFHGVLMWTENGLEVSSPNGRVRVWLPNEPTYGMPDTLNPSSDRLEGGSYVTITNLGEVWNYTCTDYGYEYLLKDLKI